MCAEKNFWGLSGGFLFVFRFLLLVLIVVLGCVWCEILHVLWCVLTYFVVRFGVGQPGVWGCWWLCGRENFGRRRRLFLLAFFYHGRL